ncbi:MAG: helix-turn-helix transcriptional regulator [Chloroflexota bacterium]
MIASGLHLSPRYIHLLFKEEETTVSRFIWSTRLEKCRSDLVDPSSAMLSISEIAFSWGFQSSAHFSQAFRRQYGMTPSRYRAMVSQQGDV